MWKLNDLTEKASDEGSSSSQDQKGWGRWESDQGVLSFDLRGGKGYFSVAGNGCPTVKLQLDGVETLPLADEQYIRDGRWYLNYPQTDLAHALRLQVKPQATPFPSLLVVEMCLVLQTDLLDTHPTVDLVVENASVEKHEPKNWNIDAPIAPPHRSDETEEGCEPVLIASDSQSQTTVLLDSHDAPFTTDRCQAGGLAIRLFGEFLEKGVIRKARPWLVFGKATNDELSQIHDQLRTTPLPLTA